MTSIILILYFVFNISLFFIQNIYILLSIILISFVGVLILRTSYRVIISNATFVIFIFACNLLFSDIYAAILISIRLVSCINATIIISKTISIYKISEGFYYIFYPLKIFGLNVRDMCVIISIAINFIPILADEYKNIKLSLISRGFKINLINIIRRPTILVSTFVFSLFDRIDSLELSMMMKAYGNTTKIKNEKLKKLS